MRIYTAIITALLGLLLLTAPAEATTYNFGGGGITSGTTPISGGTNKAVCFDDAGVANCGFSGFLFDKAGGLTVGTGANDGTNQIVSANIKLDGFNNVLETTGAQELDLISQVNHSGVKVNPSTGVAIRSAAGTDDNNINSWPRMPLTFPLSAVAATTTTQWGEQKLVKGITVENVVFAVGAFTCSVNPTLSLLDCSATANTCTPVSTLATSGTLTGIGVTNAATTPTANAAAGEYLAVEFTAGTCTVFNATVTAMARPQ